MTEFRQENGQVRITKGCKQRMACDVQAMVLLILNKILKNYNYLISVRRFNYKTSNWINFKK